MKFMSCWAEGGGLGGGENQEVTEGVAKGWEGEFGGWQGRGGGREGMGKASRRTGETAGQVRRALEGAGVGQVMYGSRRPRGAGGRRRQRAAEEEPPAQRAASH